MTAEEMIKSDEYGLTARHEEIMKSFINGSSIDASESGEEMILLETELRNRGVRPGWSKDAKGEKETMSVSVPKQSDSEHSNITEPARNTEQGIILF